jgi:hypothetical protein
MEGRGMSESKGYNGWRNYETWCINLWLTNDECSSSHLDEMTMAAEGAVELAHMIKDWVEESWIPDLGATMAADLLGAAVSEVDWYEIAESHFADREELIAE